MIQNVIENLRRTEVGLKIVQDKQETTEFMLSPVRLWSSEIACDEDIRT